MKTMMFCAAVGALFAVSALSQCAHASALPADYCESFADRWYAEAVALGSETPDGVYEQAEADCELQAWALDAYNAPSPVAFIQATKAANVAAADECFRADCQPLPGEGRGEAR